MSVTVKHVNARPTHRMIWRIGVELEQRIVNEKSQRRIAEIIESGTRLEAAKAIDWLLTRPEKALSDYPAMKVAEATVKASKTAAQPTSDDIDWKTLCLSGKLGTVAKKKAMAMTAPKFSA